MNFDELVIDGVQGGVCAPKGFKASGIKSYIRRAMDGKDGQNKNDMALIYCEKVCNAAAVFTQNQVKGAPLYVGMKHLQNGKCQAVIVNSVNANVANRDGLEIAEKACELVANALNIEKTDVIPSSTGVIGQKLPIEPFMDYVPRLAKILSKTGNGEAVQAIMTTDIIKKEMAVEFELDGKKCRIGGMAKGSGMIHPNMATTLNFITTDVAVDSEFLQAILRQCVETTINRVSVDGDTSTSDTALIMASGLAGNTEINGDTPELTRIFFAALQIVLDYFAKKIARDGEGATKLIICDCLGAISEDDAKAVSTAIITSSLFKAAMFGSDANWGRIACAIGNSGVEYFSQEKLKIAISSSKGELLLCENGVGIEFSEEKAKEILLEEEIVITVDLGVGKEGAYAYGCDLTYDYVKINGDYRS